jgi:hypothetical protein
VYSIHMSPKWKKNLKSKKRFLILKRNLNPQTCEDEGAEETAEDQPKTASHQNEDEIMQEVEDTQCNKRETCDKHTSVFRKPYKLQGNRASKYNLQGNRPAPDDCYGFWQHETITLQRPVTDTAVDFKNHIAACF